MIAASVPRKAKTGRNQIGTVAAFIPEPWPRSNRNAGRIAPERAAFAPKILVNEYHPHPTSGSRSDELEVDSSTHPIEVLDTKISAQRIRFLPKRKQIKLQVADTGDLGGGIFPKKGTELTLTRENGKWGWETVTLGRDTVINGVECKAGWRLSKLSRLKDHLTAFSENPEKWIGFIPPEKGQDQGAKH